MKKWWNFNNLLLCLSIKQKQKQISTNSNATITIKLLGIINLKPNTFMRWSSIAVRHKERFNSFVQRAARIKLMY